MKQATGTWYTEKSTEERPSSVPGMVDLYRAGKFIATVPATKPVQMGSRRVAYGIKSERTEAGIVWHVMRGWRDDLSAFATWTKPLSSHSDYSAARAALRAAERP